MKTAAAAGGARRAVQHVPSGVAARYYQNLGVMFGTVDRRGLAALARSTNEVADLVSLPEISLIHPQEDVALGTAPEGTSWGIRRLKADQLWERGLTGEGILIGHVDTGVDASHPALANAVDAFAEFDRQGAQIVGALAHDTGRHGTYTAGLMVGQSHDGSTFGVAPGAKVVSAIVIEGGQVPARLIGGLDWCIGQGVKIINISLGLRGYDNQFEIILKLLRQRGILPVVAVGNEGPQASRSPGNYPESLSVGAIDESDQIWIDSSSQQFPRASNPIKPDLVGPGVGIWSSVPGGRLASLSGTSMATPHIAGLAALLWQHRPDATVDKIEEAIFGSCRRPPAVSSLRGNRGVPDGVAALGLL